MAGAKITSGQGRANQGPGQFLVREAVWSPFRLGVSVRPPFSFSCGDQARAYFPPAPVLSTGKGWYETSLCASQCNGQGRPCVVGLFPADWHGAAFVIAGNAPGIHVHSNTAGIFACGAVTSSGRWLQVQWPESWSEVSIAAKEMAPIVRAAATWSWTWHCCNVFFHCDNAAVVAVIQRKSTRNALLLHLLHCLYFYAAIFQFSYSAHHLPGVSNVAAMHYQGATCHCFFLFSHRVSLRNLHIFFKDYVLTNLQALYRSSKVKYETFSGKPTFLLTFLTFYTLHGSLYTKVR